MLIESSSNPRVKAWASLKTAKGRQGHQAFLAEGTRLVNEALQMPETVEALLVDVSAEIADEWVERGKTLHLPVVELSPQAFATVSDTVTPQGVMAVVKRPRMEETSQGSNYRNHVLLLDGLQDPGNVGTLLRTAEAFGIEEVCCGSGTADPFSPKVVRASMGAVFRLRLLGESSTVYIDAWKRDFPDGAVVICDADAPLACQEHDFRHPALIVIGSEATGPSQAVLALSDTRVQIPMTEAVESLNAAVAGSVVLYEAYRQRQTERAR